MEITNEMGRDNGSKIYINSWRRCFLIFIIVSVIVICIPLCPKSVSLLDILCQKVLEYPHT